MCEIPNSAPMGHSPFWLLDNSRDPHVCLEFLAESNIDVLHTLGVHLIRNQFWQYSLYNVYQLWQTDELHQLLLGLGQDLLHWLLKFQKARNVKDQFDNWFTSVPPYPGLERFSKQFDWLKSGSCQAEDIRGIIRSLAANRAPIADCSKNDRKNAVETAFVEMEMGAVQALCEFSLHVSQQNHSDLSLTALDDALKQFYKKKVAFWEQKVSKSAKVKVDERLARQSHQLWVQKILGICAAMEVNEYGAGKVTASKRRHFHVRLNRIQLVATMWSDADQQRAIEQLEHQIHKVTPAKCKLFNKLFQHHQRQSIGQSRD